jgi:MFS-type transporter involved in bile tolerance (Atg22 family)
MGDLKDPRLMYLKAALFALIGALCVAGLLAENFNLRTAFLLALAIWSFCRLYYFAFYVIEHYIDSDYKFAGLLSLLSYWWRRR